jgi:polyadenylate-binding protein-interacting protein 1
VALDYLTEVIQKLNDSPGMFENFQKKMREMYLELANNHFVISNAIEIIFEQVIGFVLLSPFIFLTVVFLIFAVD